MIRLLLAALTLAVAVSGPAVASGREPVLKQVEVPHSYYWREMYVPHLTSGPSSVDWSADGRSVVFSMQGRLWRQRLGETAATQITEGAGYDYQPDVSPDGALVVFTRYLNDAYELVIRDLKSGRETAVTRNGAVNVDPRWSPDGKTIAYVSTHESGHFHIVLASFDNGQWRSRRWRPERVSETPRYYYAQIDHELSPVWSPDGKSLAFVANPEIGYGTGSLWRQPVDLSAPAALLASEETAWKARPDWSPDGKRVAYASFAGRQWHQLWITHAEPGGYPLAFSYGDFDIVNPRWSPDGTRIASISNEEGGLAIVVQDMAGGARTRLEITQRRYLSPVGALQARVMNEDGETVPARVSVVGADGRFYAPDDALIHADDAYDRSRFASEPRYFHLQDESLIVLPPGEAKVTVWRGLAYAVETHEIEIRRDMTTVQAFQLSPLPNADAFDGWRSGDVHVHMNYGGAYRMTPEKLAQQADAEALDVVFNLIVNKEQRIPDIAYFTPAAFRPEGARAVLLHGQEYHTSLWGHLGLIGLKEHYLLGDYAAYPKTALHSFYPDNATVAGLARQQGALVGYVHPYDPPAPDPAGGGKLSHALPADAVLGNVDYVEIVGFSDPLTTESVWHKLLNTGLRIPAAGGTDAMTNYASLRGPVGQNRTLVAMDAADDPREDVDRFMAALKAGKSIATNGPLVMLTLDGAMPGDEVRRPRGAHVLKFRATMASTAAIDSLDIIVNGEVAQSIPLSEDGRAASSEGELMLDESAWVTLRAVSKDARPEVFDLYPYATTSPIYVAIGGKPVRSREAADHFIAWMDRLEAAAAAGDYNTQAEKDVVLGHIRKARRAFEKRR